MTYDLIVIVLFLVLGLLPIALWILNVLIVMVKSFMLGVKEGRDSRDDRIF